MLSRSPPPRKPVRVCQNPETALQRGSGIRDSRKCFETNVFQARVRGACGILRETHGFRPGPPRPKINCGSPRETHEKLGKGRFRETHVPYHVDSSALFPVLFFIRLLDTLPGWTCHGNPQIKFTCPYSKRKWSVLPCNPQKQVISIGNIN